MQKILIPFLFLISSWCISWKSHAVATVVPAKNSARMCHGSFIRWLIRTIYAEARMRKAMINAVAPASATASVDQSAIQD